MNSNIYNSIILSNEQVDYLMKGTAGINRLSCLFQLIQIVTRKIETSNKVEESATSLWELNMSEVAISKLWKCDRKTVSKMLDNMNRLGILSSIQTRRGSIHTLLCISAWIVDGKKYVNPHYVPINMRGTSDSVAVTKSATATPNKRTATANEDNGASNKAEIPNKEDPPTGKTDIPPLPANTTSLSSLGFMKETEREMEHEEYAPSVSEMALEDEAKLHLFNEQMKAWDVSQNALLGENKIITHAQTVADCHKAK